MDYYCIVPRGEITYALSCTSGYDSETFLDQARCMAHVTHAYHLQHENLRTMMAALKQLNAAEEAQEDIHEVMFYGLASFELT